MTSRMRIICQVTLTFLLFLTVLPWPATGASPIPAETAHESFQIDPGLSIELIASEPLATSPVAIAWDDRERLFVVENRGYPTGMPDGSNGGVVAMLTDPDGDGRMDRRTLFADGFTFPNGLLPWDGGFFVTCAPDIFFLKDTDGDDRADVRQVVLTGFDTSGSTQLRVAHPILGPDGWIYLTSGLTRAGDIHSPLHPNRPAVRIGTDSRFHPFTYEIEAVDGRGQFGQTFDDWGNRFHCMNRIHIQHTVLPSRFLNRNPDLLFNETVQNVPEGMVDDLLKSKNVAARIYPISDHQPTADSHAGTFTAACSIHVYRGNGLPPDYYGDVFTCDPTANLVHRDRLIPAGPTFRSRMVNEGREFLASKDAWFRPVFLATGPDGALYVADMYRKTIEHPDYLPVEVRKRTDFNTGRDLGRIWRITSQNWVANQTAETFEATESILIDHLGHPNVWHRERALRTLLANRRTNSVPALEQLLNSWYSAEELKRSGIFKLMNPQPEFERRDLEAIARVNALNALIALSGRNLWHWDLDGSPGRLQSLLLAMVADSPGVRLAAWRFMSQQQPPALDLPEGLLELFEKDPNAAVRFQIALTLGNFSNAKATDTLAGLALRDGTNRWMRAAFLSGIHGDEKAEVVKRQLLQDPEIAPSPELAYELGEYFGKTKQTNLGKEFDLEQSRDWREQEAAWRIAYLGGFLEGLGFPGTSVNNDDNPLPGLRRMAGDLMSSPHQPILVRKASATVNIWSEPESIEAILSQISPSIPRELASHLLGLVIEAGNVDAIHHMLSSSFWSALEPGLRSFSVQNLLQQSDHAVLLFEALSEGILEISALTLSQRDRLKELLPENLQEQAASLLVRQQAGRMEVYERFKDVADMQGDPEKGKEQFSIHCASCHRLEGHGYNVGPDLFGNRNQSRETILLHLLVPNQEVYPDFAAVTVETSDGRSLTGIVQSQSEQSITLVQAQGLQETVARDTIESISIGTVSLMPEGFEEVMTRRQLADLLAFLKGE